MKVCSKCGLHPAAPGHRWCRGCKASHQAARRAADHAAELERQRKHADSHRDELNERQRKSRATEAGAAKHRAAVRAAEAAKPEAQRARRIVARELRAGRLIRPTQCERCFADCEPEAHHTDYARPLYVEWLCTTCHGKEGRT